LTGYQEPAPASAAGSGARRAGRSRLRSGAIGGLAVGVMSAAFAAPSTSIFFNSPFVAANAGLAMPAAFLASAIAIGFVAVNIAAFSRKLPTSGYAYTFVSHGLGPKAGFVAAWMTLLVFIGSPVILAPYFGVTVSTLIENLTGVHIPWVVVALLLLFLVGTLAVLGISDSLKVGGVFVVIELTAVTVFAAYMLIKNPGHQAPAAFSPRSAPSLGAFAVAMIFGILSFQGFEAAATLGEETTAARVRVPRALLSAIVVLGIFYTFSSYGATIGWGSGHLSSFAGSTSPFVTLGQRYAGAWLADIFGAVVGAGLLAGTIASVNASARMLFAMGRERVLPSALGRTSQRTGTPMFAALVVVIGGGLAGIVAGVVWSPSQVWGYMGSIISLGAIIVYIMVSVGVAPFFWRSHRSEFSIGRHVVVPVVAVAVLLIPLTVKHGLLWPLPAFPFDLVPYLTVGWLVLGGVIVVYLQAKRPGDLQTAGRITVEGEGPENRGSGPAEPSQA
jgi:amino acid transporter